MNCTSCNKGILKSSSVEGNLPTHSCTNCHGHWILIDDFIAWSERNSRNNPEQTLNADVSLQEDTLDTKKALMCPVTGAIMTKYHISTSTKHRLDYSAAAGGIWLDDGEWELLKAEGLAGSLNSLVTEEWQNQLKNSTTKSNLIKLYQNKFGDDSYAKIKEIKAWLEAQPEQSDLRAYLLAADPYST